MKRPQYVFRPNINDPQHRRAWELLQQMPPAKRKEFLVQSILAAEQTDEVHCHHFLPRHLGGTDQYSNLRIVHVDVHRLIHATTPESIQFYLRKTGCYKKPCLDKINRWRASANLPAITL